MKKSLLLTGTLVFAMAGVAFAQEDSLTREDKEFLKNASESGVTEVELGKLAKEKGGPEVKKLGETLVADHSKMNDELAALAKSKNVELKMEPALTQKQMLSAFEGKSGEEFDKEFREHAKKDHKKAIKMFEDAAEDAKDADVKAFAAKHLEHLKMHLTAIKAGMPSKKDSGEKKDEKKDTEENEE